MKSHQFDREFETACAPQAPAGAIFGRITAEAAAHLQIRRAVLVLLAMSMTLNLLIASYLLVREDQSRTVVIAPDAGEPYIAMNEKVSVNLLERFSTSALGLVLNLSPQTARWQIDRFLEHVAPESYAEIAAGLRRAAASLERNQAASAFFAEAATVDAEAGAVCISGLRRTLIGRAVTDETRVSVCLKTAVRMGRLWIVQLQMDESSGDERSASKAQRAQIQKMSGAGEPHEGQRPSQGPARGSQDRIS